MVTIKVNNQTVDKQYIAELMVLGSVHDKAELVTSMEKLQAAVEVARNETSLTNAQAKDLDRAKESLGKAVSETKEATPDQGTVVSHLKVASNALGAISALGTLGSLAKKLIDIAKEHL